MWDAYRAAVLADRPSLVWPLWEGAGTTAFDLSGNGRNGTYNGSPVHRGGSPMRGCPGVLFDGGGRYVQANASLVLGSSFSYEVWFERLAHLGGQTGDINTLIGDLVSTSNGAVLRFDGAATLRLYYAASGAYRNITVPAASAVTNRNAVHIVATVENGGQSRIIINGKIATEGATTGTPAGINLALRVARSEDGRYIHGSISWAAAYNAALSPDSARRHYDAGMRGLRDTRRLSAA